MSSLHRGHANFLYIIPILSYVYEETSIAFLKFVEGDKQELRNVKANSNKNQRT